MCEYHWVGQQTPEVHQILKLTSQIGDRGTLVKYTHVLCHEWVWCCCIEALKVLCLGIQEQLQNSAQVTEGTLIPTYWCRVLSPSAARTAPLHSRHARLLRKGQRSASDVAARCYVHVAISYLSAPRTLGSYRTG